MYNVKGTETGQLPSFVEIRRVADCNPADLGKRWKLSRLGTLNLPVGRNHSGHRLSRFLPTGIQP